MIPGKQFTGSITKHVEETWCSCGQEGAEVAPELDTETAEMPDVKKKLQRLLNDIETRIRSKEETVAYKRTA